MAYVKVGGIFRNVKSKSVKVNGSWRNVVGTSCKVNNVWRSESNDKISTVTVFSSIIPSTTGIKTGGLTFTPFNTSEGGRHIRSSLDVSVANTIDFSLPYFFLKFYASVYGDNNYDSKVVSTDVFFDYGRTGYELWNPYMPVDNQRWTTPWNMGFKTLSSSSGVTTSIRVIDFTFSIRNNALGIDLNVADVNSFNWMKEFIFAYEIGKVSTPNYKGSLRDGELISED